MDTHLYFTPEFEPRQPDEKTCYKCKQIKPSSNFRMMKGRKGKKYLNSYCHDCYKEYRESYYKANKEKFTKKTKEKQDSWNKIRNARYRNRLMTDEEYRQYISQQGAEYRAKNADKVRSSKLRSSYGITLDDYNRILESQNGLCAICKRSDNGEVKRKWRMSVDHDHVTGKVRGVLCSKCNRAIGLFNDDPDVIIRAAEYLRKHQQERNIDDFIV